MRQIIVLSTLLLVLGISRSASAGYYVWQYSTNGFMNPSYIPNGGAPDTNYQTHYNYAYRPVSNQSHADTLVVFLPGTGARTDAYTDFYENAVNEGYFVVGLDYINDHNPESLCTSNAGCMGSLQQQLVMGNANGFYDVYFGSQGTNPAMSGYNSIVNRFGYYLKWLISTADVAGSAQWQQFCSTFDGQGVCTVPNWSKIIIAGHSQGGMVVWWILKNKGAQKGLALSAPSPRMNTQSITPAPADYTPFQTNLHPSDTAYDTFDNGGQYAGKLRVFLNFYDARYKPGVTLATPNNPNWVPGIGRNQPGNLVDIGKNETRVSASTVCNTSGWTQWVTIMEQYDANGAPVSGELAHLSTAMNGDAYWSSSAPGFRRCVWNYLLEQ